MPLVLRRINGCEVFLLLRYNRLVSAVRSILRGDRREEAVRFMAFRSQ